MIKNVLLVILGIFLTLCIGFFSLAYYSYNIQVNEFKELCGAMDGFVINKTNEMVCVPRDEKSEKEA